MEITESKGELIRGNEERIYVSVRLRPLNDTEILSNDVLDWECINDDTIVHKNASFLASDRSMYPTAYTFDKVFRTDCFTREVYDQGAKDVALSVIHGINSTVFAYGQTSSGKTYTMTGITEYAVTDIYDYIHKHPGRDFVLKFSAMEIYNESIQDLLSSDSTPLRLLDDPERGTIVEKLTEETLRDKNHVTELLSICEAQRQIGDTSLNEMSSRPHQIIRLTIESSSREFLGRDKASTLAASVNFVDLAGSERASQSLSAGTRLKEGCHINRSLLTLGTVIRKLSKERNGHIPYRDSKLTRILQTSLGGNTRTAIICTMSPARSHVEQSRNTLLFASCAKEVTTNAKVNVVMSDKALVKHLQKKVARLENEMRSSRSNVVPSNYIAIIREKDAQIEKLEKEIKDLILQRDIAQSKVKEFIQILGDNASSITQVELGQYPHLRVQKSSDAEMQEQETDLDSSDGYSRTSSEDHIVKIPNFYQNFEQTNGSPRILQSSSNSSQNDSYNDLEEIDRRSNVTSEDQCKEVHCIETLELSNKEVTESDDSSSEEHDASPAVKVHINGSPNSVKDQEFISSPLKRDNEVNDDILPSEEGQELISSSEVEGKEWISPMFEKEKDLATAKDSLGARSLNLARSKSCKASIYFESSSPWFKMMEYCDNTPSVGSEKGSESCERKIYTFGSGVERSSRKESESPSDNALDIEIEKFSNAEDGMCSTSGMTEKAVLQAEQAVTTKSANEISPEVNDPQKKNVKDVGLDLIEDECSRGLTSWPVEFKRLQREIIKLWHACNVSLVHRTYFFLLFQGDPSDAIYLEVEIRRMKFLKDKFSRGDKTIVNGRRLTLSSSAKALRNERQMLSEQMSKKFTEEEREILFLKWSIGLNTKMRRLQLAHRVWTKTDNMNHIADSAVLVAKLVGLIEPGQVPNKEMFGVNFTPKSSTGICSFKRSLVSIL